MSLPSQTVNYITSPSTKLQNKEAAHKRFKYGSPKLRDLLRQQCRVRLKERRNNNFIGKRNLLNEERAMMEDVVKEGISQFEQDELLQDLIYKELRDDMEEWLVEETNYLSELDVLEEVICPLCQIQKLVQNGWLINCNNCGFHTKQYSDLNKLGDDMKLIVLQHEVKCLNVLTFFSEPRPDDSLCLTVNAVCDQCEFYARI